uniref:Uncharacterized protein n=1 Tax=Anguilla anguilla TaxID=7936 RepID=A0A0E9X6W4_ANGAN
MATWSSVNIIPSKQLTKVKVILQQELCNTLCPQQCHLWLVCNREHSQEVRQKTGTWQ